MKIILKLCALFVCFSAYAGGATKEEGVFSIGLIFNGTQRYGTADIQKGSVQEINKNDNQFVLFPHEIVFASTKAGDYDVGRYIQGRAGDLSTTAHINGFYGMLLETYPTPGGYAPTSYLSRPKLYSGNDVNFSIVDAILTGQIVKTKNEVLSYQDCYGGAGMMGPVCDPATKTMSVFNCDSGSCRGTACQKYCSAIFGDQRGAVTWYAEALTMSNPGGEGVNSTDRFLKITYKEFTAPKWMTDKRLYFSGGVKLYPGKEYGKQNVNGNYTYQKGVFLPIMMLSKVFEPNSMNSKPVKDVIQNLLNDYSHKVGQATVYDW